MMEQASVTIKGKKYKWDKQDGLEPDSILAVQGWIKKVAGRYICKASAIYFDKEDLVQSGSVGAMKATKTFCPAKGAAFLTWAHFNIIDEMRSLCCHPATESLEAINNANALIDPAYDDRKAELAILADQCLSRLSKEDRMLLTLRFGINGHRPHSLEDLGHKYALTHSAIAARIKRAIKKIRSSLGIRPQAPPSGQRGKSGKKYGGCSRIKADAAESAKCISSGPPPKDRYLVCKSNLQTSGFAITPKGTANE
jgi:RNA polymerase sigma factor (sigma-70 family)